MLKMVDMYIVHKPCYTSHRIMFECVFAKEINKQDTF